MDHSLSSFFFSGVIIYISMPWQDQFKGEKIYLANFQTAVIRAGSHSEEDLRELVTLPLQSGVKSSEHTQVCWCSAPKL